MIPQTNQVYRHFKGNLYRVIAIAEHTENNEKLVVYQALYGEYKVYARPLSMFMEEVDKAKYPDAIQNMRFEPVEQMVEPVIISAGQEAEVTDEVQNSKSIINNKVLTATSENEIKITEIISETQKAPEHQTVTTTIENEEETVTIDPLLEAYLDADSYREKLNILHGLHHRITENMLVTMAVVIDFELPEGDIETKYDALHGCLLTKEKYECNRIG